VTAISPVAAQELLLKNARERMDILAAYREGGSYRVLRRFAPRRVRPATVLADRMGCLKADVVANTLLPIAQYVRFATHYGFRPEFRPSWPGWLVRRCGALVCLVTRGLRRWPGSRWARLAGSPPLERGRWRSGGRDW
jgi:hypothetical protein